METNNTKQRNNRIVIIIALIISIISLSIAYAAMSSTLKINSKIFMNKVNWRIKYSNVNLKEKYGTAKENKKAYLSDELIIFDINLEKNNDKIAYEFTVENSGDFDAQLAVEPIINGIPNELKEKVKCTITDIDGNIVKINDELLKGTSKKFIITFELVDSSFLADKDRELNITTIMLYEQK